MNPTMILALLSDLYAQVTTLTRELQAALAEIERLRSADPE